MNKQEIAALACKAAGMIRAEKAFSDFSRMPKEDHRRSGFECGA